MNWILESCLSEMSTFRSSLVVPQSWKAFGVYHSQVWEHRKKPKQLGFSADFEYCSI